MIDGINSDLLICPNCHANDMGGFKIWESREANIYNVGNIETFILYKSCDKWIYCCLCNCGELSYDKDIKDIRDEINTDARYVRTQNNLQINSTVNNSQNYNNNGSSSFCKFITCLFSIIIAILYLAIYPILMWFDLINYYCGIFKKYDYLLGYVKKTKKVSTYLISSSNIWNDVSGLTIDEINNYKITKCSFCKCEKDFIDFLPIKKQYQIRGKNLQNDVPIYYNQKIVSNNNNQINVPYNNIQNQVIDSDNRNMVDMNNVISINFISQDYNINYNMPCQTSTLFSECKEKLLKEYPMYNNKNIYFISGGDKIEENKTMEENKIKSGNVILIIDC